MWPPPGAAGDFRCREVTERIKKVEKYSYQRNFAEAYQLTEDYERYLTDPEAEAASLPLAEYAPGAYLERHVPYMDYQALVPEAVAGAGKVRLQEKDAGWATALQHPPERILNFPNEELECRIFADIQRMVFEPEETASRAAGAERLEAGRYLLYRFPYNDTGFICATIRCEETTELHFQFDEIIVDGQVDPLRMGCVNDIRLTLAKGTYRFQTFEPYVMQGLRVLVLSGACVLEDVRLQEYAYPAIPALKSYRDPELQLIYDAAVRTFRQNSPDIYMVAPPVNGPAGCATASSPPGWSGSSPASPGWSGISWRISCCRRALWICRRGCCPCVIPPIPPSTNTFPTGRCGSCWSCGNIWTAPATGRWWMR